MSTDRDLVTALRKAAEVIVGRSLTDTEANRLVQLFNESSGTHYERSKVSITKLASITERQLQEKVAASDNTDRVMQELLDTINNWKPGS